MLVGPQELSCYRRTPRAVAPPSVGRIACSQYVPRFSIHTREATPVHGQFLEKGTFNMGERCGEWIENGGTVTYDPCPPGGN